MTIHAEWLPADTTRDALQVQWAVFRQMSSAKRLKLALSMSDSLREVVASGVRSRHPEFDDSQVKREAIRLTLDEQLFRQVNLHGDARTMTQEEYFLQLARSLEQAGIPFMLSGSHASSFHGRPRATNDVDVVIDPTPDQLEAFLTLVGESGYVNAESARDALRRRSMFNVVDFSEGWKADLIIRKDRPFSLEEFKRRQVGTFQGVQLPIASAEDVILSKLEWNRITPSERQLQDALHVAVVQWSNLDQSYLRHWAASLGVVDSLEELLRQAEASH
jgi:hypothetical protein